MVCAAMRMIPTWFEHAFQVANEPFFYLIQRWFGENEKDMPIL